MARENATKKQQELMHYIAEFLRGHDYAPSYREIMSALGYKSVSTVAVHVDGLIAKGYLTKSDKSARSIRIASSGGGGQDAHLEWFRAEIAKRNPQDPQVTILKQALTILEE
jgi:SOS-response transcriptional repressor LexA